MKEGWNGRYVLLCVCFVILGLAVIGRVVSIQLSEDARRLPDTGVVESSSFHVYFPPRGEIYDREGRLLAGNRQVYEVAVDLNYVRNPETIAFALANVMKDHPGYNESGYYADVFAKASGVYTGTYQVVADYVTEEELASLMDWSQRYEALAELASRNADAATKPSLAGLVYRPRTQRVYPENELASNILGFVNWEGDGVYGVEQQYNDTLAGKPLPYLVSANPLNADELPTAGDVGGGSSLILTLDRDLQAAVEKILDDALASNGAEGGTIAVMEAETGEILAMAGAPRLDPNFYYAYDGFLSSGRPYNMAVSGTYEPGSVFKVLTMSIALDTGLVTPETTFQDGGSIEIGGIWVYNWNFGAWGEQTMTGCMQHSLNVCMVWLVKQIGPTQFYDYLNRFGMGHLTGVDLAYEGAGRLKRPGESDWYEADLGTNAFGQGVSVTPVQMLAAVSALANDGQMVTPHLVRAMVSDGRQYTIPPSISGSPISAATAHTITEMLAVSLEEEASDAVLEGYRVAGKTGTAEIATPTGYTSGLTHASFVGWGPADDPKYIIYIWFEKPVSSPWGSVVAAPVFREVYQQVALLMHLPPDAVRQALVSSK